MNIIKKNVLYLFLVLSLAGCVDSPEVQMVKSGSLGLCSTYTVSQLVNSFMGTPSWDSGTSEDGQRFVNVSGDIMYANKPVRGEVQFILDSNNSTFEFNAFEVNEIPQMELVGIALLSKMCASAKN